MDRQRHRRRGETLRRLVQRTRWTTWTRRLCVDGDRLAHNPEVAGSNPAPATNFRRSRPFPSRERAFCVSGTVVKRVAATALRAAWQRDGGDGVTRDETAWTWWTLPPAIAGCLAHRYRKCIPVSSHSCWTTRNMRNPGLGQGRQRLVVASGCQEREIRPCSSPITASRDAAVPMRLCISSNARCPRSGFVLAARACNRRSVLCQCQAHCWGRAASRLVMWPLTLLLPHVGCGVSQLTLEDLPGSSLR